VSQPRPCVISDTHMPIARKISGTRRGCRRTRPTVQYNSGQAAFSDGILFTGELPFRAHARGRMEMPVFSDEADGIAIPFRYAHCKTLG